VCDAVPPAAKHRTKASGSGDDNKLQLVAVCDDMRHGGVAAIGSDHVATRMH